MISGTERQILEKFWEFFDKRLPLHLVQRPPVRRAVPDDPLGDPRHCRRSATWSAIAIGFHPNCDLREVLNFNGTINPRQMRFNLDLACKIVRHRQLEDRGHGRPRGGDAAIAPAATKTSPIYCLEDVRATCELYLKLEKTLLQFEMSFREAEERAARAQDRGRADCR